MDLNRAQVPPFARFFGQMKSTMLMAKKPPGAPPSHRASCSSSYLDSLEIASAALPATTQLADPATTASSSNQRNPKSSMHSGKSGLMMMYPGITAPGMYALSALKNGFHNRQRGKDVRPASIKR